MQTNISLITSNFYLFQEDNQKKILDRIKDLEALTNQMNMEFDEIREVILSKEINQFHGSTDT